MVQELLNRIRQNAVLKDFFLNSFWSIVGTFISKFLLFLVWIFVAQLLKANLYGEFSMIRSTTMLFADFVASGIGLLGTNYIAKFYQNDALKVNRLIGLFNIFSFAFGLILCFLAFVCSDVISERMLHRPDLMIYLQASSVVILVSSINNNQYGILRGFNQYKTISKLNLLQIVFSFPVYFIGTYYFSLKGAVFAYVFYNVIVCIFARVELMRFFKRNQIKPSYKGCMREGRTVLSFVLPYVFAGFLAAFLSWYNETKLVSIPDGYAQMGYYSIVNVLLLIIIGVSFMVCIPFVSMMSKYRNSDSILLLEKLNMCLPLQVALLISVPLMLIPEIVAWIYGSSYSIENIRQISNYMFFFAFLRVYRQAIDRFVAVKEKTWLYFLDSVTFSLLSVLLFYVLYDYGVLGFVWGQTIAYVAVVLFFLPLYVKFDILPTLLIKDSYLIALIVMLLVTFLISFLAIPLWGRIIICLFVLAVNIYMFKQKYLRKLICSCKS